MSGTGRRVVVSTALASATPPTSAIAAAIKNQRARDARTSLTLTLTHRSGATYQATAQNCASGALTLTGADGVRRAAADAPDDVGKMLWLMVCESEPMVMLGKMGGLIASHASVMADDSQIFYQLGTTNQLSISHALERVLGMRWSRGRSAYRVSVAGELEGEAKFPRRVIITQDNRQLWVATLERRD